jgi:plastocyanin
LSFTPASVDIAAGGSVTWSWSGRIPHDVSGDSFGSGDPSASGNYTATFPSAGSFSYVCTVHAPGMAGTVNVH